MKKDAPKQTEAKPGQQTRSPSIGASSKEGAKQHGQHGASQFTEQDRADIQADDDEGVGANRN
jgi:hypothetical protein